MAESLYPSNYSELKFSDYFQLSGITVLATKFTQLAPHIGVVVVQGQKTLTRGGNVIGHTTNKVTITSYIAGRASEIPATMIFVGGGNEIRIYSSEALTNSTFVFEGIVAF